MGISPNKSVNALAHMSPCHCSPSCKVFCLWKVLVFSRKFIFFSYNALNIYVLPLKRHYNKQTETSENCGFVLKNVGVEIQPAAMNRRLGGEWRCERMHVLTLLQASSLERLRLPPRAVTHVFDIFIALPLEGESPIMAHPHILFVHIFI